MDLENFLATKNLTLSDRLQEAQYDSEEGFKKVWVVTTESSGDGCQSMLVWLYNRSCPHTEITRL